MKRPFLKTNRLILRPPVPEDAPAIQRWMTDRIRTNLAESHGVTIPEGP